MKSPGKSVECGEKEERATYLLGKWVSQNGGFLRHEGFHRSPTIHRSRAVLGKAVCAVRARAPPLHGETDRFRCNECCMPLSLRCWRGLQHYSMTFYRV